jgi:hypothetical protein
MERMYQRNKIQEESLHYEHLKHTGELPIIGVNTFLDKKGSPTILPNEVIRSTKEEKDQQIANLNAFHARNKSKADDMLKRLQDVATSNGNLFQELMETVKYCSLGQITHALYEVGGSIGGACGAKAHCARHGTSAAKSEGGAQGGQRQERSDLLKFRNSKSRKGRTFIILRMFLPV